MAPMGCRVYLARPSIVPCEGRKDESDQNQTKERHDTEVKNADETEGRLIHLGLQYPYDYGQIDDSDRNEGEGEEIFECQHDRISSPASSTKYPSRIKEYIRGFAY
jgi:hypothetical protein